MGFEQQKSHLKTLENWDGHFSNKLTEMLNKSIKKLKLLQPWRLRLFSLKTVSSLHRWDSADGKIDFKSSYITPHYVITLSAVTIINTLISSSNAETKRRDAVMSPELREAVTQTAAHRGRIEENGRMTSVAPQSMAAPKPPEAWDTGKCKWGKSIDGETSFFSPAARP